MVSIRIVTLTLSSAFVLAAQTSNFRDPSTPNPLPPAQPPVKQLVSPEVRGDIFMAKKMYREAIEVYRDNANGSPVMLNKTGIAYHQLLDLQDAKKYYQLALKANPSYAEAVNNLGTVEYSRKNYRRSIALYRRALKYTPNSASIYSNLGTAFFARKDYKNATVAFQRALELDPEVFEHRGTGGVLLQERSVEERAKFHFYLAKMYAKQGDTARTLQNMRKAIEEGFKDRKKFQSEPEFAALQDNPEFKELLVLQPRVL
ncbi:MAG: tetratricopeptide repeat protein [Acidobacteriaceae bacterium]|nr:tetratricopeptide repeat protein [Acidobacteriaceae bacterium]